MSYDQWKTASPYDDEPDPIEEGQAFIKRHKDSKDPDIVNAIWIIETLLDEI